MTGVTAIIVLGGLALLAFLGYASYAIEAQVYMRTFCRKKTTEKVVALTFDDGPDSVQTPQVLDLLRRYQVTATFFCIGHQASSQPELVRQIVREGHLLGNHSYSHACTFPLYRLRRMKEDLRSCQRLLEGISQQPVTLFRPPFGVTNPTVAQAVKQLGYTSIGWNIRSLDTQILLADHVVDRIRKRLSPGSVILLHDRLPHSAEVLQKTLQLLQDEGYKVVSLTQLINDKI